MSPLNQNNTYFTVLYFTDEPLNATGYMNWHPGQPNYDGHCVAVQRSGQLHDASCDIKFAFFCEKEF
jgi:Lectin C-type domain.